MTLSRAVLLLLVFVCVPAAAAAAPPPLLTPCAPQGVSARCGTIYVPENRAKPLGRLIGLHVVVIPSESKPRRPDAFAYLEGGPGGAAATDMPSTAMGIWPGVNRHHDILLVDQRGTGDSHPIVCKLPNGDLASPDQRRTYIQGCIRSLKADPTQYGTRAAADDLEAVRVVLGYRALDVYGTSYGATVAQMYLRRYPNSVRTMVLDSGTFVDVPFYSRFAPNAERALDLLAARCAAHAACARAFPDWRSQFRSLIAKWNEHPARYAKTKITGDALAGAVQSMLLQSGLAASIPFVVTQAAKGNLEPLSHNVSSSTLTTSLMYWSIMCNEPWVGLASQGPWHTDFDGLLTATLAQVRTVCTYIPRHAEPSSAWTRPRSSKPVLVLAGADDPQDPITNLPGLEQALPNSRVLIAPGQGHGVGQTGCLGRIVTEFVARGTAAGLDSRCVQKIRPPDFVLR
jgi:pimeloyl-ACP methyl ester carboxylesterase